MYIVLASRRTTAGYEVNVWTEAGWQEVRDTTVAKALQFEEANSVRSAGETSSLNKGYEFYLLAVS